METDVLIIGGGLAGFMAADTVIRGSELRVALLRWGSGASPFIHGFCMPVGPGDSPELFLQDTLASGYGQSDPKLARKLCYGATDMLPVLRELDCEPDREAGQYRLIRSLGSSVPRIATAREVTGPALLSRLRRRLAESGRFRELSGHRALELVVSRGRVLGARCYRADTASFYTFSAGVTILACGGFGRLFPESTNSPDIGGDGIAMAYQAGAELTDMEFIQFEPTVAVWPDPVAGKGIVSTMFYDGAVLRGADGRRFLGEHGEQVSKDVLSRRIWQELQSHGGTPHGGVWFDARKVPEEKWKGVYKPYLDRYLACGIDLRREPVPVAPAAHTTCGGVKIDESCRTGIPGLLACGEVTGGLHGANRLGGNAGLETMVFGTAAGISAIADWRAPQPLPEDPQSTGAPEDFLPALRQRLGQLLRESCGVVRRGDTLREGIREADRMLARLGAYQGCFEAHRLYNDLLTARITMVSAERRRESLGCHCREDAADASRERAPDMR